MSDAAPPEPAIGNGPTSTQFGRRWARPRRAWFAAALILLFLIVPLGVAMWFAEPRAFILEGFDAIRDGMTQPEVESLLGGPPGWYESGRFYSGQFFFPVANPDQDKTVEVWIDFEHCLQVIFKDGRVIGKSRSDLSMYWNPIGEPTWVEKRETDLRRIRMNVWRRWTILGRRCGWHDMWCDPGYDNRHISTAKRPVL